MAQHIARGVPDFVTEIAVSLHSADIELDIPPGGCQRIEGISECVGAITRNSLGELLACRFLNLCGKLRLHQIAGPLLNQRLQLDAVNQVDGVKDIAFRLGHFLAFTVAHQAVHIDGMEGDLFHKVQRHHDHSRYPEEDDVETGYQH